MPTVVEISDDAGTALGSGESFLLGRLTGQLTFAVTMPGDGAVTVKARLEERDA